MKNMLNILGISLMAICLLFTACKKEDVADPTIATINYDGENLSAPSLEAGSYRGAAKFPASSYTELLGGELVDVEYYILEKPTTCLLRVYKNTGNSVPEKVYEANIVGEVSASSWNTHTLATPVPMDNDDLWVSIEFSHNVDARTLGCDEGPAFQNGDLFYDVNNGPTWTTLRDAFNNAVSINWNIRANIRKPE